MASLFNYRDKTDGSFKSVPILSTAAVQAKDITGDGVTTVFEFQHGKKSLNVIVQMVDLDNFETVEATTLRTDENTVTIQFGEAPAVDKKYRILVF